MHALDLLDVLVVINFYLKNHQNIKKGLFVSKETKQERIIRGLLDQTSEHLHDLKSIEENLNNKEADVEFWAQSFLKSCLGFSASTGYSIRSQEAKGKMRPDLIVSHDSIPIFVVEVKRLGFDLNKSDFRSGKVQLSEYLYQMGDVRWGMLTNGYEWKLYDFSLYGGIEVASFDLRTDSETIDISRKMVEEQCYEFFDLHEHCFEAGNWEDLSKEAQAFSPESLAKAVLSNDVIKYIARSIRGEHEYRANHDVLTDKIYSLLELGLNEAISGWNETKIAEFNKYIKAQKRANRKVKRSKKPSTNIENPIGEPVESIPLTLEAAQVAEGKGVAS